MLEDEMTENCRQQCKTAAEADKADSDLMQFMEDALVDLNSYIE